MEHNHSLLIPPHFDRNNNAYWKVKMKPFLKSLDERVLLRMVGRDQPILSVNGNIAQKEDASFNSKAMNAIFNVVAMVYSMLLLWKNLKGSLM